MWYRFTTATAVLTATVFSVVASAAEVEILRDHFGVPHIYAEDMSDAMFALAYVHAEDNLDQVLSNVAHARGQAANVFGRQSVQSDYRIQLFRIPEIVATMYEDMSSEQRACVDAYAEGINRYLEDRPERRPKWLDTVQGSDILAIAKWFQLNQQVQNVQGELGRVNQGAASGSNLWAVGPPRSKNGETMLLSDPHIPWTKAFRWYESQLIIGDRWIYGVGFYGFMGIAIGFTQDVAWGTTNNQADHGDVYLETLNPNNPDQYLYEGEWLDMEKGNFDIEIDEQRVVSLPYRRTHHGPVLREDPKNNVAYTCRLAGLETVDLTGLSEKYFNATTVKEHYETNRDGDHFKWHRMAIDRHGNIGYFYFSATHDRDDSYNWRAPVDGSIKETEWGPRISWKQLPFEMNPPSGYLMNCNNNPYTATINTSIKPENYPKHLADQSTVLSPLGRPYRADQLIRAKQKLDFDDMERISMDVMTMTSKPYIKMISAAYDGISEMDMSEDEKTALEILTAWDGYATVENRALAILTCFVEVGGRIEQQYNPTPAEARDAFLEALALVKSRWGSVAVPWGEIHVTQRMEEEWGLPGSGNSTALDPFTTLYMTSAVRLEENKLVAEQGSSWMMLVKYDEGDVEARTIVPWGNSENPESSHYSDQTPLFSKRQYKRALLTREEIEGALESRLVLSR